MEKQSIALMCLAVLLATFCVQQGSAFNVGPPEIFPGKKKKKIPYRPRSVARELAVAL